MNNANLPPRIVIVAAIDPTASEDVVRTSALLGQMLANVELHFLHVLEPVLADRPDVSLPRLHDLMASARETMATVTGRAREWFGGRITSHVAVGTPWREILQLAADLQADTIVVGSHRRNIVERWLIGSVSERVVRQASCAVIVARPKDYGSDVPEIEPPCPDCVATQKGSAGDKLWCERHSHHHAHGRVHYDATPSFGVGSTFLHPEG